VTTSKRPDAVNRNHTRLMVERSGSGEQLVLVHGIGASRRIWDPVVAALGTYHDVLALDLPGFGDSPPLPAGIPPSAPVLAEAIEHELDGLGVGAVHIAGNSMGGQVALEFAARGRAKSVIALAPTGGWTRVEARYARLMVTALRVGARLGRPLANPLMRPAWLRAALLWTTNSRGGRMDPAAAAAGMRELADQPGFPPARAWFTANQAEGLERIACPVTIAWGTRDRLLFPRQGTRLASRIPGARLVSLPGLGHVPMSDDPQVVAAAILEATGALPYTATDHKEDTRSAHERA
jgi:pimeloyl-ACP methyl ester carboxylesterase